MDRLAGRPGFTEQLRGVRHRVSPEGRNALHTFARSPRRASRIDARTRRSVRLARPHFPDARAETYDTIEGEMNTTRTISTPETMQSDYPTIPSSCGDGGDGISPR